MRGGQRGPDGWISTNQNVGDRIRAQHLARQASPELPGAQAGPLPRGPIEWKCPFRNPPAIGMAENITCRKEFAQTRPSRSKNPPGGCMPACPPERERAHQRPATATDPSTEQNRQRRNWLFEDRHETRYAIGRRGARVPLGGPAVRRFGVRVVRLGPAPRAAGTRRPRGPRSKPPQPTPPGLRCRAARKKHQERHQRRKHGGAVLGRGGVRKGPG